MSKWRYRGLEYNSRTSKAKREKARQFGLCIRCYHREVVKGKAECVVCRTQKEHWRNTHKEKIKEKIRDWLIRNPGYYKKWRKEHPKYWYKYVEGFKKKHPNYFRDYYRRWRAAKCLNLKNRMMQ